MEALLLQGLSKLLTDKNEKETSPFGKLFPTCLLLGSLYLIWIVSTIQALYSTIQGPVTAGLLNYMVHLFGIA